MKKPGDPGLYAAINAKRARIKAGSGEKMRKAPQRLRLSSSQLRRRKRNEDARLDAQGRKKSGRRPERQGPVFV